MPGGIGWGDSGTLHPARKIHLRSHFEKTQTAWTATVVGRVFDQMFDSDAGRPTKIKLHIDAGGQGIVTMAGKTRCILDWMRHKYSF
jgi:hypothetical protein